MRIFFLIVTLISSVSLCSMEKEQPKEPEKVASSTLPIAPLETPEEAPIAAPHYLENPQVMLMLFGGGI